MKRVFVLGAGFSKACAALPVAREMMPLILERAQRDDAVGASEVVDFYNDVERRFLKQGVEDHGGRAESSDLLHDFEFLLTILDLNSDWSREAQVIEPDGSRSSWSLGKLTPAPYHNAPMFIQKYIYEALWVPVRHRADLNRFVESLTPDDTIVSFNYDLVLDRAMYDAEFWHPKDGYALRNIRPITAFEAARIKPSSITAIKLHGSLNWDIGDGGGPVMIHGYHDISEPYFPGGMQPPTDKWETRQANMHGFGILPSFIKSYQNSEILHLWKQAHQHLEAADEIVVIGYSLNEADSAVWLLFATSVRDDATIRVYDTRDGVSDVVSRFRHAVGCEVVEKGGGLDEYLSDSGV
jgi:hypothetical protein